MLVGAIFITSYLTKAGLPKILQGYQVFCLGSPAGYQEIWPNF